MLLTQSIRYYTDNTALVLKLNFCMTEKKITIVMKNHFLLLQLNIIWRFNYYSINWLRFLRDKILVSVYDLCLCYGHNLKRHSFFILWLLFRLKLLVCAKRAANFSDALIQAFSVENEVVKSSLLGFRERFGEAFD